MKTALIFGSSGLIGNELLKTILLKNNYSNIKIFVESLIKINFFIVSFSIFLKAFCNFFRFHLNPKNWKVMTGKPMNWKINNATDGIKDILPSMKTDIILDNKNKSHRIIIDTKFTNIFHKNSNWYREKSLKSGYIYQLYAYLRSQEGAGEELFDNSSGMLLHPAIGEDINESATIQGHEMRFSTIDLTQSHEVIKNRLLNLVT